MTDMTITHEIDLEDLAHQLVSHNDVTYEDLLEFIKAIDEMVVDWDFTQMCHDYFSKEIEGSKKSEEKGTSLYKFDFGVLNLTTSYDFFSDIF